MTSPTAQDRQRHALHRQAVATSRAARLARELTRRPDLVGVLAQALGVDPLVVCEVARGERELDSRGWAIVFRIIAGTWSRRR
jgi:hypothetical protein